MDKSTQFNFKDPKEILIAMFTLHDAQTDDEKSSRMTIHQNGMGFNSVDAPIMSSFVEQVKIRGFLSQKQFVIAEQILQKYTSQLEILPRAKLPVIKQSIMTPPKKMDGMLRIIGKNLHFIPNVYPSTQIRDLGFKWGGKDNGWTGALCKANIEGIVKMFPDVEVGNDIKEYLLKLLQPVELSSTVHKSSLFDFQKESVAFLLKSKRDLLALAPGLGKTASSIFAANELKDYSRVLVICPLTLTRNWQNEIRKWIGKDSTIWHGNVESWSSYDRWVITNYDTAVRNEKDLIAQNFKIIIIDESILVKNRKTVRSHSIKRIGQTADYLWLLSGSPISKFYDDMWSQLNIIDGHRFGSYWRFAETYCVMETNQWGTAVVNNQLNASSRIKQDLSDIYFCRSQDDVLDLPDWIFDSIEVPMSKIQYKYYDEMEKTFIAQLPDGDEILAPNVLSQMIRLLQFASNPLLLEGVDDGCKWRAVEEMLEFEQKPAIVWTQFIHTANLMQQRLNRMFPNRVEILTGQTPQSKRQEIVDQFQNGELDVLIAHPGVGKFGLTLTRARTAIYMERSYNGDDYYQSLHRVRRIGTTISPHVIHLMASRPEEVKDEGFTIDNFIDKILDFRKNSSISITSKMVRDILGKKE